VSNSEFTNYLSRYHLTRDHTFLSFLAKVFKKGELLKMWKMNEQREEEELRGLVRNRTIPTELPPLVGEVTANFCG
jgi:hypothetical protein